MTQNISFGDIKKKKYININKHKNNSKNRAKEHIEVKIKQDAIQQGNF